MVACCAVWRARTTYGSVLASPPLAFAGFACFPKSSYKETRKHVNTDMERESESPHGNDHNSTAARKCQSTYPFLSPPLVSPPTRCAQVAYNILRSAQVSQITWHTAWRLILSQPPRRRRRPSPYRLHPQNKNRTQTTNNRPREPTSISFLAGRCSCAAEETSSIPQQNRSSRLELPAQGRR